jgi:N-acylglucosamine 2-epimerase
MRVDPTRRDFYMERAQACVDEIFKYHVHSELKAVLENVALDGSFIPDTTLGRLVNPGHDIEGVWFLLEFARQKGDRELVARAEEIFNWAYDLGYDHEYGGMLYFKDILGYPPEAFEHDMKLWWVHNEIIISALMLYRDTGKREYLDIFYEIFDYNEKYFMDREYGECYGYLRRDGKPTEPPCKGSTFKGPFHLPRMLTMVDKMITEILERENG